MPLPLQDLAGAHRALQFGIYRDGDNNLDEVQSAVIDQAAKVSTRDPDIAFDVEDTTAREDDALPGGVLRTEHYDLVDGEERSLDVDAPKDMSQRKTLAAFVAHTLDEAEANHSSSTWLDLVDHGGGDGGGLQTDMSGGGVMSEDDIAGAISDGVHAHAQAHPEDAARHVDGVVANQCLMATLGMESALSHAGVRYLAASPETMVAPGAPSNVADAIVKHLDDPTAMARSVVGDTMHAHYGSAPERFTPAAAFDVFDLDPAKIGAMEKSVTALNTALVAASAHHGERAAIREDGRQIDGMTRSQDRHLPWHADRPAEELYDALAADTRLDDAVRAAAQKAETAVAATVLAHRESHDFAPFADSDYRDAAGPTVHFPVTPKQVDPWAPAISETDNAFYKEVGGDAVARALA